MISILEELGSKNPTGRDISHKYDHYIHFSRTKKKCYEVLQGIHKRENTSNKL